MRQLWHSSLLFKYSMFTSFTIKQQRYELQYCHITLKNCRLKHAAEVQFETDEIDKWTMIYLRTIPPLESGKNFCKKETKNFRRSTYNRSHFWPYLLLVQLTLHPPTPTHPSQPSRQAITCIVLHCLKPTRLLLDRFQA